MVFPIILAKRLDNDVQFLVIKNNVIYLGLLTFPLVLLLKLQEKCVLDAKTTRLNSFYVQLYVLFQINGGSSWLLDVFQKNEIYSSGYEGLPAKN